ncbi:hypothetical protein BASA81_001955 [Batrachochytrium salamandrivorans]|nr:hypothetical protein BASA81_001955 [Batrachochytrium salamandrivorans]
MESHNPLARGSVIFSLEVARTASSSTGSRPASIWEDDHENQSQTNKLTGEFRMAESSASTVQASPKLSLYSKLRTSLVPSKATNNTTSDDLSQLRPMASWRSPLKPGRALIGYGDLALYFKHLGNIREAKMDGNLSRLNQIEFGNSLLSLDELEVCAVAMLERMAPGHLLSGQTGIDCLTRLVSDLRSKFRQNPYHDFRHAVDGMQFMFYMLHCEDVGEHLLGEEMTRFLLVLGAFVQDLEHDGKSNEWHREHQTNLVVDYGNDSPLEKLAFATVEGIIKDTRLIELLGLNGDLEKKFYIKLRALMLCTDMDRHEELVEQFTTKPTASSAFLLLIKLSDVSNVAREFDEAKVWARRLEAERKLHLESMVTTSLAKAVMDFSVSRVLPLTNAMEHMLGMPHTGKLLGWRIESNVYRWTREEAEKAEVNLGL